MTDQSDHASSTKPLLYLLLGTALLAIGWMIKENFTYYQNDPSELTVVCAVGFAAPGLFLLIAGAVAQGIVAARR